MAKASLAYLSYCLILASTAAAARGLADGGGEAFGGRKDYSPPGPSDPHHTPSPTDSHGGGAPPCSPTPPQGGGGGYGPPSPSIGTSPATRPTPGGGSYSPPSPSIGTSPTTPGGGGSYYPPTPSVGTSPTTPGGVGGGYYPPSPSVGTSPTTPGGSYYPPTPSVGTSPTTPGGGGGSYYPPTPSIGTTPTPSTPFSPLTPTPPFGTTPTPFDPNTPPFFTGPCTYWMTHPGVVWGLFGYWCPLVRLFGPAAAVPFGHDLTVPEALANARDDGVGALYREGTASLLNSMVNARFPFTTQQVKDAFGAALGSGDDRAAAAQARLFRKANEGHVKH